MGENAAAAARKRRSVTSAMSSEISGYVSQPDAAAAAIVETFLTISPPSDSSGFGDSAPEPGTIGLVIAGYAGLGGGLIQRPGIVLLNWTKLLTGAAGVVVTVAGVTTPLPPVLAVLMGIVLWKELKGLDQVRIDESHAAVLWALWESRDSAREAPIAGLPARVNGLLERTGGRRFNFLKLHLILKRLRKLGCIIRGARSYTFPESIQVNYDE